MSPAQAILETVAQGTGPNAAGAQLALLTGAYDSSRSLDDLIFTAVRRRGEPLPSFDLGAVIDAMAALPRTPNAS